jgi:molybdenum cofactor biosynthesis enzyme MoaA
LFVIDFTSGERAMKGYYPIHRHPYQSIVVDITNRCNLSCHCCLQPIRNNQFLSLETFDALLGQLNRPISIKLSGGEPTLHPDVTTMIRHGVAAGHNMVVLSNGTPFLSDKLLESFQQLNHDRIPFTLTIPFDGGFHRAEAYEIINNDATLLEKKTEVFRRLIDARIKQLCIAAIIIRGVNESVIPELIDQANAYPHLIRYVHFRGLGEGGRYLASKPYRVPELKSLVAPFFTSEALAHPPRLENHCPPKSNKTCCFRFRPSNRLQVSLIEFSDESLKCGKRGRLRLGSDVVEPLGAFYDTTVNV